MLACTLKNARRRLLPDNSYTLKSAQA